MGGGNTSTRMNYRANDLSMKTLSHMVVLCTPRYEPKSISKR